MPKNVPAGVRIVPKGDVISIRIDGETRRIIESAARKRGRTIAGFVAEAALKHAVEVERAAPDAGDSGPTDPDSVPDYFRACCETARAGGTNGYKLAGYHLARELGRDISPGATREEWAARLEELQLLIWPPDLRSLEKQDYERIADWFSAQYPRCMELIPKRRGTRFAQGVVEFAEEQNGLPGLPG